MKWFHAHRLIIAMVFVAVFVAYTAFAVISPVNATPIGVALIFALVAFSVLARNDNPRTTK